ncbi:hypothetical protein WJX73_008924 [Symbiochloris irregularis]|uniref:Transcription factor CBF/NF-Y/archaeal histone domain-containing protein n=1 Tax=Symbiochloris irregularis TaxID=706552 RepID=A0AAW1P1M4_9CHLO
MVGKTQHPLAPRIKKMMQTDEDVGKISQLAPPLIACALDLLVRQLCKGAAQLAQDRGVRTVSPSHLKSFIVSEAKLDFLKELVADVADLPPADEVSPRKRPRATKSKKDGESASAPKARKANSKQASPDSNAASNAPNSDQPAGLKHW